MIYFVVASWCPFEPFVLVATAACCTWRAMLSPTASVGNYC